MAVQRKISLLSASRHTSTTGNKGTLTYSGKVNSTNHASKRWRNVMENDSTSAVSVANDSHAIPQLTFKSTLKLLSGNVNGACSSHPIKFDKGV